MIIGYTTGVFDLFHIGHLNILRNARAMCDRLIVGVTTDELLQEYKGNKSIIPFEERIQIVRSIEYVDVAIAQESMNKFVVWQRMRFDIMFVGDDWHQTTKWELIEAKFSEVGVRIAYFPYTKGTSSTLINEILQQQRSETEKNNTVSE